MTTEPFPLGCHLRLTLAALNDDIFEHDGPRNGVLLSVQHYVEDALYPGSIPDYGYIVEWEDRVVNAKPYHHSWFERLDCEYTVGDLVELTPEARGIFSNDPSNRHGVGTVLSTRSDNRGAGYIEHAHEVDWSGCVDTAEFHSAWLRLVKPATPPAPVFEPVIFHPRSRSDQP